MPEKRTGVFGRIRDVFKVKKNDCDDIVYEAEKIISNYINCRRIDISSKRRKRTGFANFMLFMFCSAVIYMLYKLIA